MCANPEDNDKPVWEVHARPIGATHEPWEVMKVKARTVIQAEAIMRRKGYEIANQTAMKTKSIPDQIDHAQLKPLACGNCDYELSGLVIERASVICPECSHPQPLMLWSPHPESTHSLIGRVLLNAFAMIGFLIVALILIVALPQFLL